MTDAKGASLIYPKVATSTPFRDQPSTQGKGAEHQALMDLATCSSSHVAGAWLGGSAAEDIAYYYRPVSNCTLLLSVCSNVMDIEYVVLTLDEVRRAHVSWLQCKPVDPWQPHHCIPTTSTQHRPLTLSKMALQAAGSLAQFSTCFYQDAPCARGQSITLDLHAGATYVILVRGSHGEAGPFVINLDCAGTPGGLPSWLVSGALLHVTACQLPFCSFYP